MKRTRQIVLSRAVGLLALAMVFGISGAGRAQAANALIVSAPGYAYPATIVNLTTLLTAATYTVTTLTAMPPDLSTYAQVWDVRIDTGITGPEATIYTTYLSGGGSLFLMGENIGFVARNNSIISFVSSLGGGTIGPIVTSFALQTIRVPFTLPNAVATVAWQASGRSPTSGSGSFITTEAGGGSSMVFDPGTLAGAPTGALILVFDINFLLGPVTANETDLAKNIIAYLASPIVVTPPVVQPSPPAPAPAPAPPPLSAYPPTITSIANQLVSVGTTRTLSFTVGGSVIFDALRVSVSTSNIAFIPTLFVTRLDHEGHYTVTVVGADGRSGSAVITLTVSDTTRETSTSFTYATSPTLPGRPGNLVASPSGSGVALTWSEPNTGTPGRYVIAGSTTPGGSNVSVFVTPDASTNYVVAMIPPGTYYFRVWAVGDTLGPASNEATVVAAGSTTVFSVPSGLVSTVDGANVTVSWNPSGPTPSQYLVELGSSAGASDVAIVTAVSATHTRAVRPGLSFVRVRSFNGGAPSAPSNETSVAVGLGGCLAAPFAPVLLPAAKNGGIVTLSWLPPLSWVPDGATAADSYRVELIPASGAVATTTVGAGTSNSWSGLSGTYRARVTGLNRCGTGAVSNEVGFSAP